MTSLNVSKPPPCKNPNECPEKKVVRPLHPYPVAAQVLFGLSFVLFLIFFDRLSPYRLVIYGWTLLQILLGTWLFWGRIRARKRVLHCLRCGADIP